MWMLAWRNLMHQRLRLAISIGGIALSIMLILVIGGVFDGSEAHAVSYIMNQPAPLWLMQDGVENMHMSSSILPPTTITQVQELPGIEQSVGVLFATVGINLNGTTVYSYLLGIDPDIPFGGAWTPVEGSASPGLREIVIDRDLAARYGLGIGDSVEIMGFELTIAGLSRDAFGIATSVVFVNKAAMALLMGVSPQAASYILVEPETGTDITALADALRSQVPEANVMTREALAASDQLMIRQMGADIISMMNSIAYVIGILIIGMTIYTAVLEREREYGVLKAIGAGRKHLLSVVFTESFAAGGLGFLTGVVLAYGTALAINQLLPEMAVLITPMRVVQELPAFALVIGIAALLPLWRVLGTDPLMAFKS